MKVRSLYQPGTKLAPCIILCCLFGYNTAAQKNMAFYTEAGGAGIAGSINIEKNWEKNSHSFGMHGARFGMGLTPKYFKIPDSAGLVKKQNGLAFVFVLGYNFFGNWGLTGVSPNHLELGLNVVIATPNSLIEKIWEYKEGTRIFPSFNIGFRHQPVTSKGLMWRINYCPLYLNSQIKHWAGISLGCSFN